MISAPAFLALGVDGRDLIGVGHGQLGLGRLAVAHFGLVDEGGGNAGRRVQRRGEGHGLKSPVRMAEPLELVRPDAATGEKQHVGGLRVGKLFRLLQSVGTLNLIRPAALVGHKAVVRRYAQPFFPETQAIGLILIEDERHEGHRSGQLVQKLEAGAFCRAAVGLNDEILQRPAALIVLGEIHARGKFRRKFTAREGVLQRCPGHQYSPSPNLAAAHSDRLRRGF